MNPLRLHLAAAALLLGTAPEPQKSARKAVRTPVLGTTSKRAKVKAARKAKHRSTRP